MPIKLTAHQHALFLVMLGVFLFSLKGIIIKLAYHYFVGPTVLMTLRMLFAMPFYLWILLQSLVRLTPDERQALSAKRLSITGLFGLSGYYLASWLDLVGLTYLPANLERIILYTYPSIVLILSVWLLGQRLTRRLATSLIIVYAGLALVFMQDISQMQRAADSQQRLGGTLVFASAIAFAVYVIGSELMMRRMPSRLFTAIAMLAASLGIIVHYSIACPLSVITQQPLPVYGYALFIAIVCTVIPSLLLSAGIQRVGAATASLVGSFGPIATLVVAFMVLGETLSVLQLVGFTVIMGGIILLSKT